MKKIISLLSAVVCASVMLLTSCSDGSSGIGVTNQWCTKNIQYTDAESGVTNEPLTCFYIYSPNGDYSNSMLNPNIHVGKGLTIVICSQASTDLSKLGTVDTSFAYAKTYGEGSNSEGEGSDKANFVVNDSLWDLIYVKNFATFNENGISSAPPFQLKKNSGYTVLESMDKLDKVSLKKLLASYLIESLLL
ncbi:MAG: hypothetical protein UIT85_09160 [Treponema sp.]|nr:hypothetical protein [Treponema sp.]MDY5838843.1 hypothetical protein [Treponema sp.]MEE0894183.1 hypothetical protein [Treponema sp.]